jgi:hypothetical protein
LTTLRSRDDVSAEPSNGSLVDRLARALELDGVVGPETVSAEVVVRRLLRGALLLAPLLVAGQAALHLTDIFAFDRELNAFDADEDGSVFAWASSVMTFAAGLGALLLAVATGRRAYGVLALLLVFFSFDDTFRIHERAGEIDTALGFSQETQLGRLLWPILYFPLLAAGLLLLLLIAREAAARIARFLLVGTALLGAAVALEATTPILFRLGWEHRSWPYEVEVLLEESAELVGWLLIAAALGALASVALSRTGNRA